MNPRAKRVPRLWCALQGLLPLEACLDAQRAELALPPESAAPDEESERRVKPRNRVAANADKQEVSRRGSL